jgi:hypothetical protein
MSGQRAQIIAGYRLEQRLAVGGMAEIFRAVRSGPGAFAKTVALKMVLPELARDAQFIEMFLEEARLAARLSSPHLVQVFDFGEQDGTYFMAMELVEGVDLAVLLDRQGPLPLPLAIHLGRQLCAALVDLHGARDEQGRSLGIVHRDVSPGNVLLSLAGDIKLGDLGIARAGTPGLRTERGAIKGKLAYLSPEQARGDELDPRTDIYGVGLLLFETLTGQRYLAAAGEAALLRLPAHRFADARQLDAALAAGSRADPAALRRQLATVVRQAAAVQPGSQRPVAVPGTAPRPAPAPTPEEPRAGARATEVLDPAARTGRRRVLWLGLGLAAVLVGAIVTLWSRSWPTPGEPTHDATPSAVSPAVDARPLPAKADAAIEAKARDAGKRDAAAGRALALRRHRRPARTAPRPPVLPADASTALAATAARDAAPPRPRARLAELRASLGRRGVLPADLPQIFGALDRLAAQGTPSEEQVAVLARRIAAVAIDRRFVDAKLGRLNRRIAAAKIPTELQRRLRQRIARALSHAVTGRYTDANRELNAIARIIERP